MRTEEGKLHLFVAIDFVAIDRTSRSAFVKLVEKAGEMAAAEFPQEVVEAAPFCIHTVLTDNGVQFDPPGLRPLRIPAHLRPALATTTASSTATPGRTIPGRTGPWTNGQVERMNRTIKDATVKRYHHGSHDQLRTHLADFVAAHNHARRLKTPRGPTPHEHVAKCRTDGPKHLRANPHHHIPEPNS